MAEWNMTEGAIRRPGGPFQRNEAEIARLRLAGKLVSGILEGLKRIIRPGISTMDINNWCEKEISCAGARPAPPRYGFPAAVCTSVNDVAVHGVPGKRILQNGDLITVDISLEQGGWFGDGAATYAVGSVSPPLRTLWVKAEKILKEVMGSLEPGMDSNRIGELLSILADRQGVSILSECSGHGIGRDLHELPLIPSVKQKKQGLPLGPGSVFTLEPVFTLKPGRLIHPAGPWNLRTEDALPTLQWEFMIAMNDTGAEILTRHSFCQFRERTTHDMRQT